MYGFYLITVLVVDDHGEGVPVAWAITNHETKVHIQLFYQKLFKRVGSLNIDAS